MGAGNITSAAMAADNQDWLDNPTGNFGWTFKNDLETPSSAIAIGSREATNSAQAPNLTVSFTPPVGNITEFCSPADNNSTGFPTTLTGTLASGVGSGLHLEVSMGPPNQLAYFVVGTKSSEPGIALGSGHLCLSTAAPNAIGRYNIAGGALQSTGTFDSAGIFQNISGTSSTGSGFDVPLTVPVQGNPTLQSGQTWHFQLWHRENAGDSNFSKGLSVTF